MRAHDAGLSDASTTNALARATLLHITPRKWRLIRTFEALARLLLSPVSTLAPAKLSEPGPERILVIEYWNLGDLAILVPFLRNLRRSFPKAQVSLLINPNLSSFLKGQGIVDEFIPIRPPWA